MNVVLAVLMFCWCGSDAVAVIKRPIIHTNHAYLNIPENSPNGTLVVVIEASSQNDDIVKVTAHDHSTAERVTLVPVTVGINSTYNDVLTKKVPDRETEWTWYLTFQAHDNHSDTLWTLPLHIDDVNDNSPSFIHPSYHAILAIGAPAGSKILHVTAEDADSGPNAAITYSMTPHQSISNPVRYNPFEIDPSSGDITLKEELHHGELHYQYQVTATDSGVPPLSGNVLVDINVWDLGVIG